MLKLFIVLWIIKFFVWPRSFVSSASIHKIGRQTCYLASRVKPQTLQGSWQPPSFKIWTYPLKQQVLSHPSPIILTRDDPISACLHNSFAFSRTSHTWNHTTDTLVFPCLSRSVRDIYAIVYISGSFLFMSEWYSIVRIVLNLSISLLMDIWVVFSLQNKSAINIHMFSSVLLYTGDWKQIIVQIPDSIISFWRALFVVLEGT